MASSTNRRIESGESLPDIIVNTSPDTKVKITDLFRGKKGILFGLPGAFTPTCSATHLPEFIKDREKWRGLGFEVICCVSVNDAFVMEAWGKQHQAEGKVVMVADVKAEFTKAIGLDIDMTDKLGGIRSKRYSMEILDNKVSSINVESSLGSTNCSTSSAMLGLLDTSEMKLSDV